MYQRRNGPVSQRRNGPVCQRRNSPVSQRRKDPEYTANAHRDPSAISRYPPQRRPSSLQISGRRRLPADSVGTLRIWTALTSRYMTFVMAMATQHTTGDRLLGRWMKDGNMSWPLRENRTMLLDVAYAPTLQLRCREMLHIGGRSIARPGARDPTAGNLPPVHGAQGQDQLILSRFRCTTYCARSSLQTTTNRRVLPNYRG